LYLINLIKTKGDKEMKVVLRLAIVVAVLSMVSNVAFALPTPCTGDQEVCYNVNRTNPDGSTNNLGTYKFCLNDDGTGNLCVIGAICADYLKVFGGGTGWYNFAGDPPIGGNPNWSVWVAHTNTITSIFQPIGEGYLLTGVETWQGSGSSRGIYNGIKVKCP
jgi:hypothetical protein